MDLITSHLNADFDALASVMAAKRLYPDASVVFPGSLEKKVRDFLDAFHPIDIKKLKDIKPEDVTRLIVVDVKHPDRIGQLKELLTKPGIAVHIYDHHPASGNDIRGEVEVYEEVGAASTILAEIIQERKIAITPIEATALCLGIYEETGSLIFKSTTPRDLMAAAFLMRRGADLNIVASFLKTTMSTEELALLNQIAQSMKEIVIHGVRIGLARGRTEEFGDAAHLASRIMDMEDIDALVLMVASEDKIALVARSRVSELDTSRLLSVFGGGGHAYASSATVKEVPFEVIEEQISEQLRKIVRNIRTARDIMTSPVVTVQHSSRISDAEALMTRYGVNVLPVVKRSEYMGIITREVVEKALFHNLGSSRCADFATIDAVTASPDTPVSEVEEQMVRNNQRFVAVLEGSAIAGAITRTDLLRSMYESFMRKSRMADRDTSAGQYDFSRNINRILKEKLPRDFYELLLIAGQTADNTDMNAYLVGGSVRDMLRGEENLDIDIVVEGDGIAFARKLADAVKAKVAVHQRFRTAHLAKEGMSLDVATSRTEYYEHPAALPRVETSSIKKDLYRRDFTINTLAVKLNKKDFGHLIDFFGGQRDIKDRMIRVLHNLSFVEDPTRAFRAVRFAERFDFRISKHTENLIKLAVKMNIFEKLSGQRIIDELDLIFHEAEPVKVIKRLSDFNLLRTVHPKLYYNRELGALLRGLHDAIAWFELSFPEERINRTELYIMALALRLERGERESLIKRLSIQQKAGLEILKLISLAKEAVRFYSAGNIIKNFRLFSERPVEAIIFAMALSAQKDFSKSATHYLLESRHIKPILKGDDLKKLGIQPGPLYSEIFSRITEEKLLGRLATKDDEINFAKSAAAQAGGQRCRNF
ncbi:MAG: CBS domain-containing protein [Nitrospiraceae bacterium]|nr:CBS domain-containing protein [Nitrospiraceae bacterium]